MVDAEEAMFGRTAEWFLFSQQPVKTNQFVNINSDHFRARSDANLYGRECVGLVNVYMLWDLKAKPHYTIQCAR